MQYLAFLLICWGTVGAKKEDYEGLEELMNNPSLLSELEKRLGALLEENGLNSESATEELPCNATSGPLDTVQAACDFKSDDNVIIKTTDSLNNGAYFVKRMENVLCAKDCASECCNNSKCDTAVYQDKDEHKCYLFKCKFPDRGNVCIFDAHISYRVSYMMSKTVNSVPGGAHVSHENELENLGSQPVVKVPPTTEEPISTTTVKPGLGEPCRFYGAKCLDPHAECYNRECTCRAGYHEKYGVCQKLCRKEEFECDNRDLGPDARQCVHGSYRCDGNQDCSDGSDEENCPKMDENNHHTGGNDETAYREKGPVQSPDHAEKIPPVVKQPPKQKQDTGVTQGASGVKTTDVNIAVTPAPKEPTMPPSHHTDDIITTLAPSIDNKGNSETKNQSPDESPKNSNNSDSKEPKENELTYFSSEDSQKVESYTDSSQGPIVALALGLAITLILLIFVGCRLRTVKRRLRKGRALHSNEADYLINGMYL